MHQPLALLVTIFYATIPMITATIHTVELSADDIKRQVVTLDIGDTLLLRCNEGFYAEIVQQTRAQVDACDNRVNNPGNKSPDRISACLGFADNHSIQIETSSEILNSSQIFKSGRSYYYTSYSLTDLRSLSEGLYGRQSGGLCSDGLELELHVSEPTTAPATAVTVFGENSTTKGLTDSHPTISNKSNATSTTQFADTTTYYSSTLYNATAPTDSQTTSTADPLSTDAAVHLSTGSAIAFCVTTIIVALVVGFIFGLLVMYFYTRRKSTCSLKDDEIP